MGLQSEAISKMFVVGQPEYVEGDFGAKTGLPKLNLASKVILRRAQIEPTLACLFLSKC